MKTIRRSSSPLAPPWQVGGSRAAANSAIACAGHFRIRQGVASDAK
jgi:hypothetical protein